MFVFAPTDGLTSQSTQQLPFPPESHSHSSRQQQRPQPDLPWSVLRPTFRRTKDDPPSMLRSPFHRHGHTLSTTFAGELLCFGGYSYYSLRNDLYVFSTQDCSVTFLKTSGEVPSPRTISAGVLVRDLISDVLLIWGGATKLDHKLKPKGPYDDSLYLLSLASRVWTRIVVNGPGPVGRCRHAMTMVGSKLFIFGGRTERGCLNDTWALDLNSLQSKPVWDSYELATGDKNPSPRNGHVLVTTGDRIILFGGADNAKRYNDTWSFDVSTRKWTELQCTGSIPSPRNNHAAVLIDDVMYVFGGRDVDNRHLGDLIGLKLSTRQWFMLPKMGPSPSGRWSHAMVSNGSRAFMLGGNVAAGTQADETALIHVLETKHISNPKSDLNVVKPNEKTTQPALESSAGLSTQQHARYPTSSSLDAYAAHNTSLFQNSIEELGYPASPQITRERNPITIGLRSQPTSVNGKTRLVPEKDDDDEGSTEYLPGDSSEGEPALLESERVVELERQLSAILAAQTERDQRLAELSEELALKSALLERAEANAAEATKHAGLEPRELADRLLAQTSLVENKDAELVMMQAKLDELVVSRDQHVRALGRAQSALQKATSRAADADKYEIELVEVRAELEGKKSELEARKSELEARKSELEARKSELEARKSEQEARKSEQEARKSELEAIRLRLTDAENGWAKSKAEADTLRALTTAGLVGTDEDRMTRVLLERIRAMETEMADMRWSEKSLEAMETRNEG